MAPEVEYHPGPDYFDRVCLSRGPHSLRFTLAGLDLKLSGLSTSDRDLIRSRYGCFIRDEAASGAGEIEIVEAEVPGFLKPRGKAEEPEYYRLEQTWSDERLVCYSYEFAGWFDPLRRCGKLAIARIDEGPLHRAFENFLRVVAAHWFLRRGSLLIHASGVVRGGAAYLFFGPSGAGKTTVTLLSEGDLVLGDDLILLQPDGERFEACSVPFRGVYREPPATDRAFPLAAAYRLIQDRRDFVEEIPASRATAELMASLPFVMEGEGGGRAVEIAARLARHAPVHRLHFRKSAEFWSVIRPEGDKS
ncbi:MAG TPA: hypothetical protein VFW45_17005 [Candidatus Polarisedimenticolia bacterium]|nr:hypothetical protein [Candidatus Polarisedimenticolia bacterium]